MDDMLNNIPFVVVKEYFFKNTASTMIDFVKKIAGMAKNASESPGDDAQADIGAGEDSSQGAGDAKSTGGKFLDKVKEIFNDIPLKPMVIDIPYILYFCLRQKQYGNTYIFPYIVENGTIINEASNASEWGDPQNTGLGGILKNLISGAARMVGDLASTAIGSQAKAATLFPAPSWEPPSKGEGASFSFTLVLINDNVVKARNNYMCVNTIIHNNRAIQKAILQFPGALYEVWLPTGQRHLMCTGDFKLYPLGLNRMTPDNFFKGYGGEEGGANLRIGVDRGDGANIQNPEKLGHRENGEVLPDAYKLQITFKSCLANNMNTAVFQYYVKMSGYDSGPFDESGVSGGPGELDNNHVVEQFRNSKEGKAAIVKLETGINSILGTGEAKRALSSRSMKSLASMRFGEILDSDNELSEDINEFTEKFDEATYNKKLGKLRSDVGDETINSESVVSTIRKTQATIRDLGGFLAKLYNAKDSNLWYMPNA